MDDALDEKVNAAYAGKVVRKDLLHRIKKGTNVPSFVLEFLLARYCASDDPEEINAGMEAVLETLQKNYVRPDESNRAQSYVQQKGKHKFIDKIHVSYKEKEKRHWAELENFNSRRVAIPEKFYKDNDRILEGGIWAEATIAHNDMEDDPYAFYLEDLRPIQLSRFSFDDYVEGRDKFTRDEWLDLIVRTVGLNPDKFTFRQKLHLMARMIPFVEANYNFIELGPRGTGKSYVYSEFSPYSTLISGGQASSASLFYNNAKRTVGMVGYWDIIAFDEVGGVKIKDPNTITIMKDYMANGRFSRGATVIANASFAFVGNIDHSVDFLVNSSEADLFISLPPSFDLAVMDRFHAYLPGWDMPKNSSEYLTQNYGFITDYLAEAFHHMFKNVNRFDYVSQNCRLGDSLQGRDETGVKKTLCGLLKILHPASEPSKEELDEYVEYALEGRRRVKEQMNKRKPDDEFSQIDLSYFNRDGKEVIVYCPESKDLNGEPSTTPPATPAPAAEAEKPTATPSGSEPVADPEADELKENHFRIFYGERGHTYESIFAPYLKGAKKIEVEDPFIRANHQVQNFLRFAEMIVSAGETEEIVLITNTDDAEQKAEAVGKYSTIQASLKEHGIDFSFEFNPHLHDREIRLSNGWVVKIGRGFDFYQRPDDWYEVGSNDFSLRPCLETTVDIYRGKTF